MCKCFGNVQMLWKCANALGMCKCFGNVQMVAFTCCVLSCVQTINDTFWSFAHLSILVLLAVNVEGDEYDGCDDDGEFHNG